MKKKYKIGGMSCAACAAHVTKAVNKLSNVECNVSLLTNSMEVTYDENEHNDQEIIDAVIHAGYKASVYENEFLTKQEKKVNFTKISLIVSIVLMIILMYIAMGEMLHLPVPFFLKDKYILVNLYLQFSLTVIVLGFNYHYFISGISKLVKLKPNMDSLIAIGSLASFIYACVNMVLIQANYNTNFIHSKHLMHDLYFDSSAMIVTLVSVGKLLEGITKKQTTKSLDLLMDLVPESVLKKVDDKFELVSIESVKVLDLVEINPYDLVPLDGVVIEGTSNVDEASITGESMFVTKEKGDKLISGTKNQEGRLVMRVEKTSENSTMSEIIKLVEEASSSKMKLEKIVDKVALVFVPIVFLVAIITMIIWLLVGYSFTFSLKMFISILVISCPCALGLATPLCVMVSTLLASRNHILVKNADVYERLNKVNMVMFDKTGTLTKGKMEIIENTLDDENYRILASLEKYSNHPLAKVILDNYKEDLIPVLEPKTEIGRGLNGIINNTLYYAGSYSYIKQIHKDFEDDTHVGSLIYLFTDKEVLGYLVFKDTLKANSKKTIELFKKNNIKTVMLTGDNEATAKEIALSLSIDKFYSNLLPQDKGRILEKEQKNGNTVMMIGDGINDSLALEKANVGIAMNETNIARSSADIVLTRNDILDAYNSYIIARKTVKNIKLNLFWAFFYNIIMIPIAAGAFYVAFDLKMNPMIGALCMSLSSICVCLNALRLNLIKIERSEGNMKILVNDMMCTKCEAHIKEALNVAGVNSVKINLKKHLVEVETEISKEEVYKLISEAGYTPADWR